VVGVGELDLTGADDVVHEGGVAAHLPQGASAPQPGDGVGLGFGQAGVFDGGGDLVGGLAQDDLGR
jgi:hypothetical protein